MFDTNDVYVDVLLPLALPQVYTYFVPEALHKQIKIGKRVEVQFGKSRIISGNGLPTIINAAKAK